MDPPVSAYQDDGHYVFVCYSHEDSVAVYVELEWLQQQGVNLWYDEGISVGKNWRSVIGDSLINATRVLYYISANALDSDHCNREINFALDEGKEILPIYIEDVQLTSDLKVGLSRVQALSHSNAGYRQQLLRALKAETDASRELASETKTRRTIIAWLGP